MLTDLDNGTIYYPQQEKAVYNKVTNGDQAPSPPSNDNADVPVEKPTESYFDRDSYKPFATTYKNKINFEEELIKLGDGMATIQNDATLPCLLDEEELFKSNVQQAVQSGVGDTFSAIMKRNPLKEEVPYNFRDIYRQWLTEVFEDVEAKDLPKKGPITLGMRFPIPCGGRWRELVDSFENKHSKRDEEAVSSRMIAEALHAVATEQNHYLKAFKGDRMKQIIKSSNKKRKREKAVGTGKTPPPTGFNQAFFGPKAKEWVESADKEIDGLTDEGVIGHGFTHEQLIEAGVEPDPNDATKVKPIPLSIVLDHKYDEFGILQRLKTRMALSGHPGNMQKGIHFKETFSASPNHCSARLLQAICVVKDWHRFSFDITQAYTRAPLPPDIKPIAIAYPKGYRQYAPDGTPLMMLLKKNIYGRPDGARIWSQFRDKFIMERFGTSDLAKKEGWTIERTYMDPCLFKITKARMGSDGEFQRFKVGSDGIPIIGSDGMFIKDDNGSIVRDEAISLIYTDDCDMIGSTEDIMKDFHKVIDKEWGTKVVNSDFILGIKRISKRDPITKERSIEMTMQAFIEGVIESFSTHLDDKKVNTPFPEKTYISKDKSKISEEESKKYLDLGWQRLVGCLLWCARNIFVECALGVSMLCRLMSKPSKVAWDGAIHMLKWLRDNKEKGIIFKSSGNQVPIAFSDASNVEDPIDGLVQAGHCVMLAGGPVIYSSQKLKHVAPTGATSHVEYMAINGANRDIIWIRQLLYELKLYDMVDEPTILYGDNECANKLCKEDIITPGNKYIYLSYHFNKEVQENGNVDVRSKRTAFQLADVFTKPINSMTVKGIVGKIKGYVSWLNDD